MVIELADNFNSYEINDTRMTAQSGVLLSVLGKALQKQELKGFEFASGIPGTLGGALAMNAGAYGGEMKDIVKSVRLMDMEGNIFELSNEQMEFGYRKSIISKNGYIALSAELELQEGNYDEIKV